MRRAPPRRPSAVAQAQVRGARRIESLTFGLERRRGGCCCCGNRRRHQPVVAMDAGRSRARLPSIAIVILPISAAPRPACSGVDVNAASVGCRCRVTRGDKRSVRCCVRSRFHPEPGDEADRARILRLQATKSLQRARQLIASVELNRSAVVWNERCLILDGGTGFSRKVHGGCRRLVAERMTQVLENQAVS